jgi:hypothetical protein
VVRSIASPASADPAELPRLLAVLIQVLASVRWYGGVTVSAAK